MTYTPLEDLIKLFDYEVKHNERNSDVAMMFTATETLTLLHYLKWIKAERIRKHKTEE
jgi:hypothetical protein